MYKAMVRREYAIAVAQSKYATDELRRALKTSERVPAFIDRLADQLVQVDILLAKRGKVVKLQTMISLIHDLTDQFLYNCERHAEQRTWSQAKKNQLQADLDEKIHPEKLMRDMGVMTDDETAPEKEAP